MEQVTPPVMHGANPSREIRVDFLSLSVKFERDDECDRLRTAIKAAVLAVVGYAETTAMTRCGNFGEGEKFDRFSAQIKWTKHTMAALNDWDELGRCVGVLNVSFTGSAGIGGLGIERGMSLIQSLFDLGLNSCKRIDLAIDCYDDWDLDIFAIQEHLKSGAWRIPRRDVSTFRYIGALVPRPDRPTPATLYLGPIGSPSLVVIYDKAAEKAQDRAWIRFERVSKGTEAQTVFDELLTTVDAAWETGTALELLDNFVTGAVKQAADIREVTGFPDYPKLPKNWMRSPMARTPDMLSTAYAQIAPLTVGELRLQGGFAAQARHAIRSTGKTIWKMAILEVAQGRDPGSVALTMGFPHHQRVTDEDFMEMAQVSNVAIADLEAAELKAINLLIEISGADAHCVGSDRTLLREEALKRLTMAV